MLDKLNIMKRCLKLSFHYEKVPDNTFTPNSTLKTVIEIITLNFIILFTFSVIKLFLYHSHSKFFT